MQNDNDLKNLEVYDYFSEASKSEATECSKMQSNVT